MNLFVLTCSMVVPNFMRHNVTEIPPPHPALCLLHFILVFIEGGYNLVLVDDMTWAG